MSTSILYHAFGLKGIEYRGTSFLADTLIFRAEMSKQVIRCPQCSCRRTIFKGQKRRWLLMGPIGRKKCVLDLLLHRAQCCECSTLWWPTLPFMIGTHRFVRSFALTVLDLLKFGTIRSVAEFLGVGWDLVKNIHK